MQTISRHLQLTTPTPLHSDGFSELEADIRTEMAALTEPDQGDPGLRKIILNEPISSATAMKVGGALLIYNQQNPSLPIHLHIFSPGGCVVSGLSIIDTINHIDAPVFTYCIGYAASMAAIILASGQRGYRYILPHSRVMIHQASASAGGTLDNVRATLSYQIELEDESNGILAEIIGKSVEWVVNETRVDRWLNARTAKEMGLVDHILESSPRR